MQTFAHVANGVVDVIETIPDGLVPGRDIFVPAYARALVAVPSGQVGQVSAGWIYATGNFSAPAGPSSEQLWIYATAHVSALLSVERTYALGSDVSVKCDGLGITTGNLASLSAWGTANPTGTTQWTDNEGHVTAITGAQAQALTLAVSTYGQAAYNVLGTVSLAITAGTITTTASIDAASWPA